MNKEIPKTDNFGMMLLGNRFLINEEETQIAPGVNPEKARIIIPEGAAERGRQRSPTFYARVLARGHSTTMPPNVEGVRPGSRVLCARMGGTPVLGLPYVIVSAEDILAVDVPSSAVKRKSK